MHDIGLATVLEEQIHKVMEDRRWTRILDVQVKVGQLRNISPTAVQLCIEEIFRSTPSAGARVDVTVLAGVIHCKVCGADSTVEDDLVLCPRCASTNVEAVQGDELILKSLRGE